MISRYRSASVCGSRIITAISVVILVSLCSACYSVVERNDLLGTWEARDGSQTAQLRFHGDGTLELENVPTAAVFERGRSDELDWTDVVDVDAHWFFSEASSEQFSQGMISVSVEQDGDVGSLSLRPQSDQLHLYYGDVEAGRYLEFSKMDGPATPFPSTLGRAELSGTWSSQGAGELQLMEDGTFSITDIPTTVLSDWVTVDQDQDVTDLSGQWSFREQPLPLDDTADVMLSFDPEHHAQDGSFFSWFPSLENTDGGLSLQLHSLGLRWEREDQ